MLQTFRGTLVAGTRLGAYELVSVPGQGGFGITYLARDTQLDRFVAIKEYLPAALALREADTTVVPRSDDMAEEFLAGRERFIDEARTLARLGNVPSIVPVYDFLEANGTAYMVMGFAPGDTLSRRLRDGKPLSPADADRLLHALMDGLAQVHDAGFVHRDIKPDNIILDGNGAPTLIDFGASRAPVAGRTGAMTAIFTPGYAAAEQFTSGKQGPWTDIYGLAATLHHAICGSPPPSAFDRMLGDDYVPLADRPIAGFPPALFHALDSGLAIKPNKRPQSIAEWRTMLGTTSGEATVRMPPRATPKPSGRNTKALYAAGAAAVVMLLAGAGYFFATRSGPRPETPVAAVATAAPVKPAEVSTANDGKWSVYTICGAFQSQPGFEHTVRDDRERRRDFGQGRNRHSDRLDRRRRRCHRQLHGQNQPHVEVHRRGRDRQPRELRPHRPRVRRPR